MSAEALTDYEIEQRFTYHKPIGNQPSRYERIRAKARELALLLRNACPESRERSVAMTNLQQAIMWSNASIAINENESTATVIWEEMSEAQAQLKQDIEAFSKISAPDRIMLLARHQREQA
jgi:hypothetical protein